MQFLTMALLFAFVDEPRWVTGKMKRPSHSEHMQQSCRLEGFPQCFRQRCADLYPSLPDALVAMVKRGDVSSSLSNSSRWPDLFPNHRKETDCA